MGFRGLGVIQIQIPAKMPLRPAQGQTNLSQVRRGRLGAKSKVDGGLCSTILFDSIHHEEAGPELCGLSLLL